MKIKGIIFDLDGTLLDSMHCWENVDRRFLLENGVEPPPGVSDIVKKMTIMDSAMYFKTQFSLNLSCKQIIDRIEQMVANEYFNTIPLKKGAFEMVHNLKNSGYRMCIATATYSSLAHAALKRLGISDCFESVITCSDAGHGKDRPDIFLQAADRIECIKENTIVVEDSLHCIETASDAGFKTIAVYDSTADGEWEEICRKAWRNVRTPGEIEDIIRKESK